MTVPAPGTTDAPPDGPITLRRLTAQDLPMLASWLAQPHVRRWWQHEYSDEAVQRDFGASVRGTEPGEDLIVEVGGVPVALVQRQRLHDYPEDVAELEPIVTVPPAALSVDYLIGHPGNTGRGLGPRILRAVVADAWRRYPDAPAVIVPVVAANRASWRALEKAGFRRVASGDLEPENPIDPPQHHVLRIDRPGPDGGGRPCPR